MRLLGRRLAACGCGALAARAPLKRLPWPSRRQLLRGLASASTLFLLLATPSLLYTLYVHTVEMNYFQVQMERLGAIATAAPPATNGCTIPLYDPFDPRALKFVFRYPAVACGRQQPFLTYVDGDGRIRFNASGLREAGLRAEDVECTFAEIRRRSFTDDELDYGVPRVFRGPTLLPVPFVKVECAKRGSGRVLYETAHAHVPPPPRELTSRAQPASAVRPSVLVIGIDSMSRLNFVRQLPRTYELLTEALGATVFTGLVKVGDNTYPNVMTMLTGLAARKKPGINVSEWGESRAYGFFDDLPLVWKNFSDNGYVTMYAEDKPELSAFNYIAKGFMKEPTDYYMRPFWLAMEASQRSWLGDSRCFGNVPQYEYLFNYTRDFALRLRDWRYFAFSFLTGYSHKYINEVQVVDAPLYEMLSGLREAGALDNTVVVVLGDHGNRFDLIRATVLGRVEECMPFLAVALPARLRAARPYLEDGLRANSAAFISWYDVYELLVDVALDNLLPASRVARWGQLGTSLFRRVPARSCAAAGVAWEFCVCVRERALSPRDPLAQAAAAVLVAHVNAMLEGARAVGAAGAAGVRGRGEHRPPCAVLSLAEVLSAQLLLPHANVARPQGFSVELRVSVRVTPSQAMLEGTVESDAWVPGGRVKGDIARINKYGDQSHCLRDKLLRLYCYCTDLLPRTPAPSA